MMSERERKLMGLAIGSVWIFHGLYSKVLNRIPRHRAIVGQVLGENMATPATAAIGAFEVLLGLWVWSGRKRKACAATQTLVLGTMNGLEITRARHLLISAPGMLALNAVLLTGAWLWAQPTQHR